MLTIVSVVVYNAVFLMGGIILASNHKSNNIHEIILESLFNGDLNASHSVHLVASFRFKVSSEILFNII